MRTNVAEIRERVRKRRLEADRAARRGNVVTRSAPVDGSRRRGENREVVREVAARQAGIDVNMEVLKALRVLAKATEGFGGRLANLERGGANRVDSHLERLGRRERMARRAARDERVIRPGLDDRDESDDVDGEDGSVRRGGRVLTPRAGVRRRSIDLPGVDENVDTFRGEKRKFMFTRAIRYILTGRESGCEYEASIFRETEKNRDDLVTKTALAANQDSIGGFLVPNQLMNELIELIRAQVVLADAGATYLTGLSGAPVQINKQTAGGTGYWVGENQAPTESNQTFGQISLTPHTAAALVKLSKRFVAMATPAAEAMVREDLSLQMALLIDLAGLRGNGASGSPIGIANWPGILTVSAGTNGGPISYDLLVNMVSKVREANGLKNAKSVGWIMSTPLIGLLQKLRDADNRPLLLANTESAGDMGDEAVGRLLGYPVYHTTQIPTDLTSGTGTGLTEIYFGDIGAFLIGQWGGVEIAASDETSDAFTKRQVHLIIHEDLDFAVRQESRLCYCNDVQAS